MAEIVNLRRVRKLRARADAENTAAENRALHGRTRAERDLKALSDRQLRDHVEGHRREDKGDQP